MTAAQVLCQSVERHFGDRHALNGVSLSAQGGVVGVLGPNGAGKTTLLRCLATVLQPSAGTVLINGLDPRHESDRVEARRRIGYLPQELAFAPRARVFDVLDYVAVLKEINDDRLRRRWVFYVLDLVGLRAEASLRIRELSGGMKKRLGLAQALIGTPSLLILDEPAAGVDPAERLRLRELIAERRAVATVILSTHLTEEVATCDSVLVMSDGSAIFVGTPVHLAEQAQGRVWSSPGRPTDGAVASWQQADGSWRSLGTAPNGSALLSPSLEEGYLLLMHRSASVPG